ncbi:MAG: hypothetical protein MJK10_21000 [Pseudomonadales bacterium]|nr:hypothetical protein [Pseudomonadales bacterium]NRA18477.1 hypothetical protein [Oceanospirillaceae bacterium]
MLIFISLLGGVVIYELFGNLSGLDAIAIAGMIAGFSIGLFSGKNLGMFALFPSFLAATSVSFLLVILALFSMNIGDPVLIVLGQFAVGFSLLSGTVIGCQWGHHLFIREEDLDQLREAFGESKQTGSVVEKVRIVKAFLAGFYARYIVNPSWRKRNNNGED